MNLREDFVKRFGENDAVSIEMAAESHANGVNSRRRGSDPFRWAFLICIGYDCLNEYRGDHGIKTPTETLKKWAVANSSYFGKHDGDADYMSMLLGTYNKWFEFEKVHDHPLRVV